MPLVHNDGVDPQERLSDEQRPGNHKDHCEGGEGEHNAQSQLVLDSHCCSSSSLREIGVKGDQAG